MNRTRNYDTHVATEGGYEIEITERYTLPQTKVPRSKRYLLSIHGPWCLYRCFPTIKAAKQAAERVIAALKEEDEHGN